MLFRFFAMLRFDWEKFVDNHRKQKVENAKQIIGFKSKDLLVPYIHSSCIAIPGIPKNFDPNVVNLIVRLACINPYEFPPANFLQRQEEQSIYIAFCCYLKTQVLSEHHRIMQATLEKCGSATIFKYLKQSNKKIFVPNNAWLFLVQQYVKHYNLSGLRFFVDNCDPSEAQWYRNPFLFIEEAIIIGLEVLGIVPQNKLCVRSSFYCACRSIREFGQQLQEDQELRTKAKKRQEITHDGKCSDLKKNKIMKEKN